MSFKITIDETKEVEKQCGGNWMVVGSEKLEGDTVDKYGHTPLITKKMEVVTEIYKQTVEKLDLNSVIKAINKIRAKKRKKNEQ